LAGENSSDLLEVAITSNDTTSVSGQVVGFRIDGRKSIARAGERAHVLPGTAHDWWNAG
jgi:hypothetical protein